MPSLKDLRTRKDSVVSTKKITSAMKMISAAKMRKAQDRVENSKVYADMMSSMISALVAKGRSFEDSPKLLVGQGRSDRHLFVVITSDRGLCGSFNSNVARTTIKKLEELHHQNQEVQIVCIGRRGRDIFKASAFQDNILETYPAFDKPKFWQANRISNMILDHFNKGEFDICTVVYNRFISVISQKLTEHQLIPYTPLFPEEVKTSAEETNALASLYEYDPSEKEVLEHLLPKNLGIQIYRAMLENAASEHGARMTAMDSATRNAKDMIDGLQMKYNRTRQAIVTKELIEIISGAGAI